MTYCGIRVIAASVTLALTPLLLGKTEQENALKKGSGAFVEVYFNDFNGPPGKRYAEWTSSPIDYESVFKPPGSGVLNAPPVTTCSSPNGARTFLGEFGGPAKGVPGDPGWNRTRVDQTITLALHDLPKHSALRIAFDLCILKSWDGNSPIYGPDRWSLSTGDGAVLLSTTFSNNTKVATDGSDQDYPAKSSPPRTGAHSIGILGYNFFSDSIYSLEFDVPHTSQSLTLRLPIHRT